MFGWTCHVWLGHWCWLDCHTSSFDMLAPRPFLDPSAWQISVTMFGNDASYYASILQDICVQQSKSIPIGGKLINQAVVGDVPAIQFDNWYIQPYNNATKASCSAVFGTRSTQRVLILQWLNFTLLKPWNSILWLWKIGPWFIYIFLVNLWVAKLVSKAWYATPPIKLIAKQTLK
jgi:hypothetical protein